MDRNTEIREKRLIPVIKCLVRDWILYFQLKATFHTSRAKQAPSVLHVGKLEKRKPRLASIRSEVRNLNEISHLQANNPPLVFVPSFCDKHHVWSGYQALLDFYDAMVGYEILLVCFSTQLLNLVSIDSKELTPRIGGD